MKRRTVIASVAAMAAGAHLAALGQPKSPVRIAWPASVPVHRWPPFAVFTDAMRQLGWIEGQHYVVDEASYDGRAERIPAIVAELMTRQPDLIIGSGSPPMRLLMQATKTIPIIMFGVADPVGQGFVASLSRPGGNVTGLSNLDHGILAKQFELLLQAAPQVRQVGVVFNPDIAPHGLGLSDVQAAAPRLGVQVRPVAMRTPDETDATFESLQRERVDAVHFFGQPFFNTGDRGARVAALALQRRWPTAMGELESVRAGILVGYGSKIEDMVRRLAHYVTRVLAGTPPGELPVEQPTRFYVSLNLKSAKALGLALPPSLLARADEVIE